MVFNFTLLCYASHLCILIFIAGAPVVGFERTAQDNGYGLAIREGEELELCVVLLSGRLTSETGVLISTSGALEDFMVQARPAVTERDGVYVVLFGANTSRSCFNITAIDDSIVEDRVEIVNINISLTRENQVFIQVSPSAQRVRLGILDDDC